MTDHISANQMIILAPYLPLAAPVEFTGWWLGPLESFSGPWLSPEFETAGRTFAAAFRDVFGNPISRPSLLAHAESGVDGSSPPSESYNALQLAISFATVQQNAYWSPEASNDGHRVATVDNAQRWAQPLDLTDTHIAIGRGSRVAVTSGGHRLMDPSFFVPAAERLSANAKARSPASGS